MFRADWHLASPYSARGSSFGGSGILAVLLEFVKSYDRFLCQLHLEAKERRVQDGEGE